MYFTQEGGQRIGIGVTTYLDEEKTLIGLDTCPRALELESSVFHSLLRLPIMPIVSSLVNN